jgi:dihydrofolate reductase
MRKLTVSTLVTLDGVVQDPGGFGETDQGGWSGPFFDDEARQLALEHLTASDAFLLGRRTYELFKAFWSHVHEGEYAARMNTIPKLVASTTLRAPLEWNASLIEGDVGDAIATLKQQPGNEILMYGSPTLMRTLAEHDLVDEYMAWIHPIVLGRGTRLFTEGFHRTALKLVDTKTLSSGVVILTYRPA